MQYTPLLGPASPENGWVPAPRYLLRRRRILRQLQRFAPGKVLEIGCGAGMLLQELSSRGFECTALETSAQARQLIEKVATETGHDIHIAQAPSSSWEGTFPLVMAFEVLEHIEHHHEALRQWASWLAPGGTLLMSVPAHPRLWNAADVWAGHYRRYTRAGLIEAIQAAGLEIEHIECFGFPLGNLTEQMQARGIRRRLPERDQDLGDHQANSDRSGIERNHVLRWYPMMRSLPGRLALHAAFAAQALTCRLPLGNGYLLRARVR
ncbi:class I SAM-dependent methyltransferase [Oleiagrimonas sp. C23AA]|uniref:class I SAM-dependent methyltransferase n=1 Tax=Oleiagrimonas sp. C23AA TaxID=2719047 RepID=UPI001421F544|nr:class I SAM-dependent methyltransferase [Oleiagrimonas sp. C23AA]NII12131.1 class I SAM-dependent methyltransferase [Oleiagrimonas sp. C23AA]